MAERFKTQFTDEMMKNVFNDTRRYELSIKEEDVLLAKRCDRGMSIDEGPEYADPPVGKDEVELLHEQHMRLKKTTVLTGNHTTMAKRNRAQSEAEIFTAHFKAGESKAAPTGEVEKTQSAPAKKYEYIPKPTVP